MIDLIYQWIDLLWLPLSWFVVHKHQRFMTLGFLLTGILTMRTQIEIMESIGYPTGILPLLHSGLYERGLVTYGVIFGLFLLLAHFSKKTASIVFFAATLSIYIFSLCASMIVMLL